MLALIQRVTSAKVEVENETVGEIGQGLLVFLAIEKEDSQEIADRLLNKVLAYRVFADSDDKMNLSVTDIGGELLIVSQFTLAADTQKGLRPSFSSAKSPAEAEVLYDYFIEKARQSYAVVTKGKGEKGTAVKGKVKSGKFAADMKVSLLNDGPVTFMLRS